MKELELIVFGVWAVLVIGSICFFFGSKNAKLKQRVLPWFIAGVGTLFTFVVLFFSGQPDILLIVVPAVILIGYLNIRMTKFCESCGATVINQAWFTKFRYCSHCAAEFCATASGQPDNAAIDGENNHCMR